MINPENEILPDFRPSFTKEECVAKMLGWMKGHRRQKYVRVTLDGISEDQLPYLHSLDWPLQEQLLELREAAWRQVVQATESGATTEEIRTKQDAFNESENQIDQAATYLLDIEDEIAKGKESDLRIDQQATEGSGHIHITIRSLDKWARQKYGMQILAHSPLGMPSVAKATADTKTLPSRQKMREQEVAILDKIRQLKYQPDALPRNESGKPGVKSKVKKALKNSELFSGPRVFAKAWERLREFEQIKDLP